MKIQNKKGISLFVLIITIIIVIIIAGSVILTLANREVLDSAKKARFMSDFTSVQDGVNLYSFGKYNATTSEFELPLKGYLTSEDKTYIKNSVPTLNTKIEELSGSIDTTNLAWISSEEIGARLSSEKKEKGYIIDVDNGQIYDYVGDVFEGKRWHTLDGGVVIGDTLPTTYEELWDGWIKLTLYYPSGSTEKKWRLGTEGELRVDPMLMWQNYTGPITIPLDRIQDVWIKYILDGKEVTIPPAGTLLVDIVPDKTGYTKVPGVKVNITYDETATVKEYRVGDSGWITYNGEFNVTENCIIEARAKKTETIYNTDGTVLATRNVAGRDVVYIGNIGTEETDLPAPTITRLSPVGSEKARVQVVYPAEADKKIYKVNYGIEENYTTEINVESYGTYIIAYYYDASGKRSKASSIRINDTSTGTPPDGPGPYDPKPPHDPGNPPPVIQEIYIPAPTVSVSPTNIVEEVQVSINASANADKIYIKLGRYGQYQLYTSPIVVRENMDIYAYYRTYAGERSDTGYGVVSNIKKNNKPYVNIDANPYPWSWSYGASEVAVTINYSDATSIEYSEDGIVYVPYTVPFIVTENKRIYARGTNAYGVTETSLNITNIGKLTPPTPINNLSVGINVNPEPQLSTTRVAKANVTIDYDSEATEKYYTIGRYGTLQTYNGEFEVTSNCTIYAYAKGVNAKGQTSKTIDNLTTGISEPIISAIPGNSQQASKVSVSIEFDKYSTIKRYSIDGTSLRDYAGAFEVTKNGSVIYAYSENELGQKSEANYTIENIVPDPPILILDKGQYYILKLNYPETSKNREYKWKVDGEWKSYKEAGIILLKPQYKDQLIQGGTLVKIEDENGNLVTFTGDYYFIDVPISELFENLFMRWDRQPLGAPQIVITPIEPAIRVIANIVYNPNLVTKQYKVVNPDGSINKDWTDYTGPITIDRNNTVIYAKGMDDTEVWTAEAMQKVTNIDENPPVIKLTADLDTAMQKVGIRVAVTDDVGVGKVKWVAGVQGENYFENSGTEIANNSIVNITSNGYYTFYAEDQVGNKQVYTLNVTNVDLTAPAIDISVSPEDTVGLSTNVTINYGDSTTKQYKIGTSNATWSTYTSAFAISSYTILSNNWQNADGTVTVYAKGKDAAGNEITVQKKVVSLDLDKPNTPVIVSSAGYPILTSYGVILDANTTITYDTRTDIDNLYSVDNGVTWSVYTGQFNFPSGTVIAKSVKKDTGLEVSVSKTVAMPSNAVPLSGYDGSDATGYRIASTYILVDTSMQNEDMRMRLSTHSNGGAVSINYLDVNGTTLLTKAYSTTSTFELIQKIPLGTVKIYISMQTANAMIYEIGTNNSPVITSLQFLPTLTTYKVENQYSTVTMKYFPTSVQRLYSFDGITWQEYKEQAIRVEIGQTIYAKGIDKNGNQTRTISSYTAAVRSDSVPLVGYDGNDATGYRVVSTYMLIDSSMQNEDMRIRLATHSNGGAVTIRYLDVNENILLTKAYNTTSTFTLIQKVPIGAVKIYISMQTANATIYEFGPNNSPVISATQYLPNVTTDKVENGYSMVNIKYFPTSVQRLYSFDGTTWQSYQEQDVRVEVGQTIYAKGIDKNGIETKSISSYTATLRADAVPAAGYDKNYTTGYKVVNTYISVDSSMQGKNVRMRLTSHSNSGIVVIRYLDASGTILLSNTYNTYSTFYVTKTVPTGTVKIYINMQTANATIYEIEPFL